MQLPDTARNVEELKSQQTLKSSAAANNADGAAAAEEAKPAGASKPEQVAGTQEPQLCGECGRPYESG